MTKTAFRKDSRVSEDHMCPDCFRRCHGERGMAAHMWQVHEKVADGWRLNDAGTKIVKGAAFVQVAP